MRKYFAVFGAIFIIILLIMADQVFYHRETPDLTDEVSEYMGNPDAYLKKSGVLGKAIADSKRKNILVLGIEGKARTDVIFLLSLDPKFKCLDMISIPRDTYYHEKGYDKGDQRKINAAYGRKKEKGSMEAASIILGGVPIHNYVSIEYKGAEAIIDALGGIEVEAPCDMKAGGIEIKEGLQKLNGKQALQFLRFRKGYKDGDLGRIKVHQKFIDKVIGKLFSSNFLEIIKKGYSSIKTDMALDEILSYAIQMKEIKKDNISMIILPGKAQYAEVDGKSWSFYFHNSTETQELIKTIFHVYKKNILEFE